MAAVFAVLGSGRIMGAAVLENVAVKGLHVMAAQALGIVGFQLAYSAN